MAFAGPPMLSWAQPQPVTFEPCHSTRPIGIAVLKLREKSLTHTHTKAHSLLVLCTYVMLSVQSAPKVTSKGGHKVCTSPGAGWLQYDPARLLRQPRTKSV